jgi:hypothetical protein
MEMWKKKKIEKNKEKCRKYYEKKRKEGTNAKREKLFSRSLIGVVLEFVLTLFLYFLFLSVSFKRFSALSCLCFLFFCSLGCFGITAVTFPVFGIRAFLNAEKPGRTISEAGTSNNP